MKQIAAAVNSFTHDDIKKLEQEKEYQLTINEQQVVITLEDVEISTEDIPGWIVANQGNLTVALDISITPELKQEGLARELINRVQNVRKEIGLEVTDHIVLTIEKNEDTVDAFTSFKDYICSETLAELEIVEKIDGKIYEYELIDGITVRLTLFKKLK